MLKSTATLDNTEYHTNFMSAYKKYSEAGEVTVSFPGFKIPVKFFIATPVESPEEVSSSSFPNVSFPRRRFVLFSCMLVLPI